MKKKIIYFLGSTLVVYFIYIWLFATEPIIMHSQWTGKPSVEISFSEWKKAQYIINHSESIGVKIHTVLTYPGVKAGQWITQLFF